MTEAIIDEGQNHEPVEDEIKDGNSIVHFFAGIDEYLERYSHPSQYSNKIISIENIFDDMYLDVQKLFAMTMKQAFAKEFILLLMSIFLHNRNIKSHFYRARRLTRYLSTGTREEARNILSEVKIYIVDTNKIYYTPKIKKTILFLSIHFEKCKYYYDRFDDQDIPLCFLYRFKGILNEQVHYTSDCEQKEEVLLKMTDMETIVIVGHGNDGEDNEGINLVLNEHTPDNNSSSEYFTPQDAIDFSNSAKNLIILGCTFEAFIEKGVPDKYEYFIAGDNVTHRKIEVFLTGFFRIMSIIENIEMAFHYGLLSTMLWEDSTPDFHLFKDGQRIM